MLTIWSRCGRFVSGIGSWFYGSWPIPPSDLQGGCGVVQAQAQSGREASRIRNTKLILTAASIVAVFVGWFLGKDPSQLQIILPSLVGSYCAANVWADMNYRKYSNGTDNGVGSGDDSGK